MRINDVILQSITRIVVFIIFTFAVYLFFTGHNNPGGGFVSGLTLASGFALLLLAYDTETIRKGVPLDFKQIAATGACIVVGSGLGSAIFGPTFLYQAAVTIHLPIFGDTEFSTVTLFETGVALAVVGVVVTIIFSISEDG